MVKNVATYDNDIPKLMTEINADAYSKVFVLVDTNTERDCWPLVKDYLPETCTKFVITPGESEKVIQTCLLIWEAMTVAGLDRESLLINLGGGVIGDMGGFCAATFKRGIAFINIPTTLLAQVDASVGGKLGVDFKGLKNHIGAFCEPKCILIDTVFLQTLPQKELRSGYAETIKHCLIRDKSGFDDIKNQKFPDIDFAYWMRHSVAVKQLIVEQDPYEKGLRKILNFGHTVGHAIESFFLNHQDGRLLHGEAIAIGMICETFLSVKKVGLDESIANEIYQFLGHLFPSKTWQKSDNQAMIALMKQDKKNYNEQIECVLLSRVGDATYGHKLEETEIVEALDFYCSLIKSV